MAPVDVAQSLENLRVERDAIALYESLATFERDERRATVFRAIAANERRHATMWTSRIEAAGEAVPPSSAPRLRVRIVLALARVLGTRAVADLVLALEGNEERIYASLAGSPEMDAIAADERRHAAVWRELSAGTKAPPAGDRADGSSVDDASPVAALSVAKPETAAPRAASWHQASGRSGTLRAVIFGVSDGLVSNLSLVMGVAGAASSQPQFILLAGIAGLLAGATSMAAGEYISMQSQRELFERQIALERADLEAMPDEEMVELAAVYRAKGFTPEEAERIAQRLFRDPELALDTLVREKLGLDPEELGSPWGAAVGSFLAFGVGAVIPVVPYLFGGGSVAFYLSLGLSLAALFAVGAGVSLLTGRSTLYSGFRQVGIGLLAAAVTYAVGSAIGVTVGG